MFVIIAIFANAFYREVKLASTKRVETATAQMKLTSSTKIIEDNYENQTENNIIVDNNDNISVTENNEKTNDIVESDIIFPEILKSASGDDYAVIGNLIIEKINLNMEITSKTTQELMRTSACRLWGPNPNEVGNLCIVGHNWRNTKLFSKVPTLEIGDTIKIKDLYENIIEYKIYDKYLVFPDDVECLNQETNGKKIVTLITCNNDSSQRYIFHAEEL